MFKVFLLKFVPERAINDENMGLVSIGLKFQYNTLENSNKTAKKVKR